MITLSEGEKALGELISSLATDSDMNEAQTRFHIIDKILFDCLNWDRQTSEVEKSEDGLFSDYELGKPRVAILEAKREGRTFEIPAGLPKNLVTDLKSLIRISNEASDAIKQGKL